MSSEHNKALDFWLKYDDFFMFHASAEVRDALRKVSPYGTLLELFYQHRRKGTMNSGFVDELQPVKDSIKFLADNSKKLFDEFYRNDATSEQKAFELFAQGLLFDDRRQEGEKIHMMDSSVTGYVVWHAFSRAVGLLGLTEDNDHLLQTDRHIALAAAILARLTNSGHPPVQSDDPSNNKPMDETSLQELRSSWLNLGFEEIDNKIVELEERSLSKHI